MQAGAPSMDPVSIWKAVSIAVTGAFGILGLLKDFKDKHGHITRWGRISLAGILASTICGVAAQIKETSDQKTAQANAEEQTLGIVTDIKRMLQPFADPSVYIKLSVSCGLEDYRKFCDSLPSDGSQVITSDASAQEQKFWANWPGGSQAQLQLQIYLFREEDAANEFEKKENSDSNSDLDAASNLADLILDVLSTNYAQDKSLEARRDPKSSQFELIVAYDKPSFERNNGEIVSISDFHCANMIVVGWNKELSTMTLTNIEFISRYGATVSAGLNDPGGMPTTVTLRNNTALRFLLGQASDCSKKPN
jgi:hypothetical protein